MAVESVLGEPAAGGRWRRVGGVRDLGPVQGSGLREQTYLLRRADGQVLQVSPLLRLVVHEMSADRDDVQVAAAVSEAYGRELTVDGLRHVITHKLAPMGLVEADAADSRPARAPRANPLLSLRLRGTLVPARAVQACARLMAPLFHAVLVIAVVLATAAVDVFVVRRASLGRAVDQTLARPVYLLALLGILLLGAFIHELGHAAACAYGGAEPGVIGVGVYLIFPSFFTNVTDSYRLDRAGRIRTDLGGLYLNVWCLLVLGNAYLFTGQGVFLLAVLLMHIEMVQQLVPTVRFDGYFLLADVAGVPDLFARVGPILASVVPGHGVDRRVRALRPTARWIVIVWVATVLPLLALAFGWLVYTLPGLIRRVANAISSQATATEAAWHYHDISSLVLSVVSIGLLVIPMLGLALLAWQIVVRGSVLLVRASRRRTGPPAGRSRHTRGRHAAERRPRS